MTVATVVAGQVTCTHKNSRRTTVDTFEWLQETSRHPRPHSTRPIMSHPTARFELSTHRTIQLSKSLSACRTVELFNCRTVELSNSVEPSPVELDPVELLTVQLFSI